MLEILERLDAAGVAWWMSGGWGIDALLGRETRDHIDLDVSIPADEEAACLEALGGLGFEVSVDWRPTRVLVTTPDGRGVDVHPCRRTEGTWVLPGTEGEEFVVSDDDIVAGTIAGRTVHCISAAKQLEFHSGYELSPHEEADMAALRDAGLIPG